MKGKTMFKQIGVITLVCTMFLLTHCSSSKKTGREGIELRYENWEVYPAQIAAHQEVVDAFNKTRDDIKVKLEAVHGGIQKIQVEIAGGTAPDVFYWCDTILPPLVKSKSVIDLTPFIEQDEDFSLDQYFPLVLDGLRYDRGIYGLPIYFGTNALVFNKDLFDQNDLSYPSAEWTWDDFLQAAQKLTIRVGGRTKQYGSLMPYYLNVIKSFGGDIFNREVDKCIFDSPEVRKALQFLLDLQNKYHVVPTMGELGGDEGVRSKTGVNWFVTGKIGMFLAPSFMLVTLDNIDSFTWDVAPVPYKEGFPRVTTFATGTLHISTQSKHPEAAWQFLKFACGKEGTGVLGKGRNNIPPIPDIAYSVFCQPPPANIRVYVDAAEYIAPILKVTWEDEFANTVVRPNIDLLYLERQSIDETIAKIVKGARKYLKKGD